MFQIRLRSRRTAAALTALAVGAGVLAGPAPASADVVGGLQLIDGMDTNAAFSTWRFERSGDGTGGFSTTLPRSDPRAAFLSMRAPGFSSVARDVQLPLANFNEIRSCTAQVWVNTGAAGRRVNVEVINPTTWKYVTVNEASVDPEGGYRPVGVGWFNGPNSVVFRVSLIGSAGVTAGAWVDDLRVDCVVETLPFG